MKTETEVTHTPWHKSAKCQSCGSTTIAYEINPDKIRAVASHDELLEVAKRAFVFIETRPVTNTRSEENELYGDLADVISRAECRP